jgi:histidinol-phosphate aminotransferase
MDKLAIERQAFFHALRDNGLNVLPSRTHFCLIEVEDAQHVRKQLLTRKILVRDCTSFGLPQFIRVATRPTSEWQQLLLALQEIMSRTRRLKQTGLFLPPKG